MWNRAMLLLFARLGLRPSEVLRLRLQDLDWTTGSVLIRAGKSPFRDAKRQAIRYRSSRYP